MAAGVTILVSKQSWKARHVVKTFDAPPKLNGRADAVIAPIGATLKEMLARPGQLVGLGQGLAYMERVAPTGLECA